MAKLFYVPFQPIFGPRGLPVGAATVTFYLSQTTTLATIYSDSNLATPLANPVKADASGKLPTIYMPDTATYRVIIRDAAGGMMGQAIDPYIPGTYPRGEDGKSIDPPFYYRMVASAGQTTFPVAGQTVYKLDENGNEVSFTSDGSFPQEYDPTTLAVFLNGPKIPPTDYSAPGGTQPIVFDSGLLAGGSLEFGGFIAAGSSGGGSTPALDELSLSDFPRQTGDGGPSLGADRPRMARLVAASDTAQKAMFAPAGVYQLGENGRIHVANTQGLINVDDFKLRGAGVDVTFFDGIADVNHVLYGDKMPDGTVQSPSITEPGSANSIKRVEMSDFTVRQPGNFLESSSAIALFGCADVHIHDIKGYGFPGDFITIGMAEIGDGSVQGHNRNVLIERVQVDGINKNNRQFLTVNDCDTITARDITVYNTTRPGNGNQTPQDPTDPNTGPPMPGAMDWEFISGSIFDVRARRSLYERWLVVNNGGAALVYNFAKGNRTNPPFPTSGTNAADIAVLISDHKARQITVDQARLGLVTADAPPQAAVGFGVDIDGFYSSNAGRSYEVTRFRSLRIANGTFYRSKMAGGLGYVIDENYYVRDVTVDNVTWEQCGLDDGLCESVYQCDGLTYNNPKVVNCNGTWLRLSGAYGRIKNLTVNGLYIQNDGLAGLPSIAAAIIVVPEAGETRRAAINRLLDLKTIRITAKSWGTGLKTNFALPDAPYPCTPDAGSWDANVRVPCDSTDVGSPEYWRTYEATNAPELPHVIPVGQKGLPKPDATDAPNVLIQTLPAGVQKSAANRFTSILPNQKVVMGQPVSAGSQGDAGGQWIIRGVFDRTSMIFIGFQPGSASSITGFHGVWFDGGFDGTRQRVAYVNGAQQPLQGAFSHEQYTRVRIYFSSTFGPCLRVYTGASSTGPWTPTGAPIALTGQTTNLVPMILFGMAGESVLVVNSTGGGDNSDA